MRLYPGSMAVNNYKILCLIIFCFFGLFTSCEKNRGIIVDCDECYYNEPDSGDLIVYLTINSENPGIPLTIYKDQVDDEWIEYIDTAFSSPYYLYVALDEFYSVKAEYNSGNRIIYAVDGDKIKSKFMTEACEFDCWIISGGVIDVELKDD
jgi:hypothetical protein